MMESYSNMKKTLLLCLVLFSTARFGAKAQSLVVGADFETRFDNREYSGNRFGESKTIFGVRLSPEAGVAWDEKNRLMAGVELSHDFGDTEHFLSDVQPIVYYEFKTSRVQVNAGIFPRSKMMGSYSEAFFDEEVKFYHHRLQGILANYRSGRSYAEFAIDWEGFRTETQREKFRILAEGRWDNGRFYAGGSLMVLHYAKTLLEGADEGVVDNMLVNPHAGMRFNAFFDFELRLGYLQSLQRDRRTDQGWLTPKGGEFHFSMSRWGVKLENRLYVGENMLPLWNIYGHDLYECNTFFGVTDHIYNRTAVSYGAKFFRDTLKVEAALVVQYDGVGCGLQQLLKIGVDLEKVFSKKKN